VADNDSTPDRAILDTSVVIDLKSIAAEALAQEVCISTVTLAELAAGPQASTDPDIRGRRQEHLQRIEATFDPIPFDVNAARAYGRIVGAVMAVGRKPRGARSIDLMIAATALANGLALITRNPSDFNGLELLIEIRTV